MNIKKLPSSEKSEKAIIWCILIDWNIIKNLKNLKQKDFYNNKCSYVYWILERLDKLWNNIDLITVNSEIEKEWKNFINFLASCTENVICTHYKTYVSEIKDASSRRFLIKLWDNIKYDWNNELNDPLKIVENLKKSVLEISWKINKSKPKNWDDLKNIMHKELERKKELNKSWKDLILKSHWLAFERWSHCVIWALPSHWKSMLLLALLLDFAKQWYKVLYVNIEMTEKQVMDRIYSNLTWIDSTIFKYLDTPNIVDLIKKWENEFNKIKNNFSVLTKWSISSWEISSVVWDMVLNEWLDVHWVDYLWILKEDWYNKTEKISKASNTIRSIAKDFNTISITAAQFSKEWYKQKPSFAFIKDSSTIYDDADIAMVLYRNTEESKMWEPTHEIKIEKNRTWNLWTIEYSLDPRICNFKYIIN